MADPTTGPEIRDMSEFTREDAEMGDPTTVDVDSLSWSGKPDDGKPQDEKSDNEKPDDGKPDGHGETTALLPGPAELPTLFSNE